MKKMMLLGVLMLGVAMTVQAQESRQDASISFIGVTAPDVYGQGVYPMHSTNTGGILASYRYMVTPRSALELNYSFGQDTIYFNKHSNSGHVNSRQQEFTGAYVYSRTYGNYNPFVEAGVGGLLFIPILNYGTTQVGVLRQSMNIGALFGGGLAYEISPSFDIRVEYRGFVTKTPDFKYPDWKTNRYYVVSTPAIGIAYHF